MSCYVTCVSFGIVLCFSAPSIICDLPPPSLTFCLTNEPFCSRAAVGKTECRGLLKNIYHSYVELCKVSLASFISGLLWYVGGTGETESEGWVFTLEGFCNLYNIPTRDIKQVILHVVLEFLSFCFVLGTYRVRIWPLRPVILTWGVGEFWIIFVDLPKYVTIFPDSGKTRDLSDPWTFIAICED
jgi:hypothetical protein